jgi:lysophospholipase L1-like esterase
MSLVLRNIKGEELTWDELDGNFNYLESLSGGEGNRIIAQTGFSLVDQDLTINAGWVWTIAGVQYTNENAVVLNFPYAAASNQRLDLVVLNASNSFDRIAGPESETNPVTPSVPNNTLLLTIVSVTDGSINEPSEPILGTQFKKKSESLGYGDPALSGSNAVIQLRPEGNSYYAFSNAGLVSIDGFGLDLITGNPNADAPYPGKDLIIANTGTTPFSLLHDGAGTAVAKFFFLDEEDLVIPAGGKVWLKYGNPYCEVIFKSWDNTKLDKSSTPLSVYATDGSGNQETKPLSEIGGVNIFDDLTDVPSSKSGNKGKVTIVSLDETELEYYEFLEEIPQNKLVESSDFTTSIINNYSFSTPVDGTIIVDNASGNSSNVFGTANFEPFINEFSCNVTERLFFILGYTTSTALCAVIIRNAGTNVFGRVVNINTATNTFTTIENTTSSDVANGGSAKVVISGDVIQLYKGATLAKTMSYDTLVGLGANVATKNLGVCIYDTTSTPNYIDGSIVCTNANIISSVPIGFRPIFTKVDDDNISERTTYSSSKIESILSGISKLSNLNVSVLGDSISTTVYGGVTTSTYWIGRLANKFGWTTYINAVSGTPIAEKATFNSFVTDSRWQSLNDTITPDVILVFGGTNDFGAREVPLGTIADDPITDKNNFYGGLKYLTKSILNDNKNAKLFFILPILRANDGEIPLNATTGNYLHQYIKAIKDVCELYGCGYIDTYKLTGLTYFNMTSGGTYSPDGLHPNALGHERIADTVEAELLSKL